MEFQPMSPDEMQRAMQFLIVQQAQFTADSAAGQARFEARFEKLEAKTDQLAEGLIGLIVLCQIQLFVHGDPIFCTCTF